MRLLFGDAVARQKVDDCFGLDLEFAGQFVNSYLVWVYRHAFLRFSLVFRFLAMAFCFCSRRSSFGMLAGCFGGCLV